MFRGYIHKSVYKTKVLLREVLPYTRKRQQKEYDYVRLLVHKRSLLIIVYIQEVNVNRMKDFQRSF